MHCFFVNQDWNVRQRAATTTTTTAASHNPDNHKNHTAAVEMCNHQHAIQQKHIKCTSTKHTNQNDKSRNNKQTANIYPKLMTRSKQNTTTHIFIYIYVTIHIYIYIYICTL